MRTKDGVTVAVEQTLGEANTLTTTRTVTEIDPCRMMEIFLEMLSEARTERHRGLVVRQVRRWGWNDPGFVATLAYAEARGGPKKKLERSLAAQEAVHAFNALAAELLL